MEKRCSECPEPRVAQSLCTFCNKWLCYQCTDMHQHQRPSGHGADQHLHQRTGSPTLPPETGSGCCALAVVICPLHKQQALELFCETCDLMACSSCHLSTHKDHRLVHVGKALQDQRWLFENLMARVEEKRSAVENTAKQIEDRLHGVKITQRKAENQIKMAKMIMMNELNKRANLLIEQLESVSSDFKQRLEDQLQGAIELCSQLDHVQNFIAWATAHHGRNPLLFSKELITFQMQHLLEPQIHTDAWVPVKIKFNWDASFWTKQISTLGQLSAEGGGRSYSEGLGRPGILRPQPVACLALPPLCHGARDPGCAFQAFCQPQVCCLHCVPPQPPDKALRDPDSRPARCAQAARGSPPPHQGQPQRWRDPEGPEPGGPPSEAQTRTQPDAGAAAADRERRPGRERAPAHPAPELGLSRHARLQPALAEQLLGDGGDSGRRPSVLEMSALAQGCPTDAQSRSSSEWTTLTQSSAAEPDSPHTSPSKNRPTGEAYSLATAAGDQACTADQHGCARPNDSSDRVLSPGPHPASSLHTLSMSPLTTYKTEPDNVYVYAYENTGQKHKEKYRISRKNQDTREAPASSKVPVVCLERLKILVSRRPPQGRQQVDPPSDSALKSESAVSQDPGRRLLPQGICSKELPHGGEDGLVPSGPQVPEQRGNSASPSPAETLQPPEQERYSPDKEPTPQDPCTDPEPSSQPDNEQEHAPDREPSSQPDTEQDTPDHEPESEPRSVPGSEPDSQPDVGPEPHPQTESTSEADLGSEADVESLQREPAPCFESEPRAESSDSDPESEQPHELELSVESEPDLEPEPDSSPEAAAGVDPGSERRAERQAPSEDAGAESEPARAGEDEPAQEAAEMENEDFCAVCLIGGDLLCCDRCPKVFHLSCHVPSLLSFPTGDWLCTLCRDVQQPEVEYDCESDRLSTKAVPYGLSACDQRKCEKITLSISSNILSTPFHEPVSPLARHYYQIIKKPMDLSVIRSKLNKTSDVHYNSPEEFVADVFLMFRNCAKFNYPDSEVAQAGHSLEAFFSSKLREGFPDRAFSATEEDDSDSEEYEEAEAAAAAGFPWPERKDQCHRKRKRRHSLNWRRHHF